MGKVFPTEPKLEPGLKTKTNIVQLNSFFIDRKYQGQSEGLKLVEEDKTVLHIHYFRTLVHFNTLSTYNYSL